MRVVQDVGHNPFVRSPYEGGLINPIYRMPVDLPQAQTELSVLRIVRNDSKSDRLPDDKRVAYGSTATRPAALNIGEPPRGSVRHPDDSSSGTDPNDGSFNDRANREIGRAHV